MPVFRGDPCGISCIVLTYCAILYADYVIVRWVVLQTMFNSLWGAFHVVIYNTVVFLAAMAHLRAVFSDPGIVPLPQNRVDFSDMHSGGDKSADWTVCARCEMYRPPRAHHCRICRRCIRRMDHHCPWINNCVGEWNQKYFMQFLFFIALMSIYSLTLIAYTWVRDCKECPKDIITKQGRLLHSIILSMESILFGLFVIAIMCDQMQAILTDSTAIEQVKKEGPHRTQRPKMSLMREVCGRGQPILWLFPCTSAPRNGDFSQELSV